MKVITVIGKEYNYKILEIFEFSSKSKKMGIIVKNESENKIMFYLKGADDVIINLLNIEEEK